MPTRTSAFPAIETTAIVAIRPFPSGPAYETAFRLMLLSKGSKSGHYFRTQMEKAELNGRIGAKVITMLDATVRKPGLFLSTAERRTGPMNEVSGFLEGDPNVGKGTTG
jgi:hypothetical protein